MSQYKNCIATEGLGSWVGRWARQQARAGALGRRRACWGARASGAGSWARRRGAQWARRRAGRGSRRGRAGQGWLGAGRAGWPWAVHSVHSACFWPGSTRYFPESNFLDIVRESGS